MSKTKEDQTKPRLEVGELSLERNHRISRVWDGNVVESRDRSRDLVGAKEGNDSELSKTSVIDLSEKALLLLLRRHVLKAGRRDDEIVSDCPTLGNADTVDIFAYLVHASRVIKVKNRVDCIAERSK